MARGGMSWGRRGAAALTGAGVGAGLMYWLDPSSGRRRRTRTVEHVGSSTREVLEETSRASRDLANRTRGTLAALRGRTRNGPVDDDVLEARVRARLGHFTAHAGAIQVVCRDGTCELRGPVLAAERARLVRQLARTQGLRELRDLLDAHEQPGSIAALQGDGVTGGSRRSWRPATRLVATGAGLGLLARVLRGGRFRLVRGAAALGLLARGFANRPSHG
jgi:hypothetical protein